MIYKSTYFTIFIYQGTIFLLLYSTVPCFSSSISYNFDQFLGLFNPCNVNLYNYKGLSFYISQIPVTTYNGIHLIADNYPQLFPGNISKSICLVQAYIFPDKNDLQQTQLKNKTSKHPKIRSSDATNRYDVLLYENSENKNIWQSIIKNEFLLGGVSYNWLMLQVPKGFKETLAIGNKLEIVNRLRFNIGQMGTTIRDLRPILEYGRRSMLDQIIQNVNDIRNNKDVYWLFKLPWNIGNETKETHKIIHQMIKNGSFTFGNSAKFLVPAHVDQETMENIVFAFTVLGANTNWTVDDTKLSFRKTLPLIRFNSGSEFLMKSTPRRFGYVTCFPYSGGIRYPDIWNVAAHVISQFQMKVYLFLVLTYVTPCCVLGFLYHHLLKRKIDKKYWVKWHPFTWGLRALVWQAGDRSWNSKRFGWMTWIAGPSSLLAVVISFAFRGNNINYLTKPVEILRHLSIHDLHASRAIFATDISAFGKDMTLVLDIKRYEDIADMVAKNKSIVYVTWEDRAKAVEAIVKGFNFWEDVKTGKLDGYNRSKLGSSANLDRQPYYWKFERWGDGRTIRRFRILERESMIVGEWGKMIEHMNRLRYKMYSKVSQGVTSISMGGRISYLFLMGVWSLGVGFCIFIGEKVWYRVWIHYRRRRRGVKEDEESGEVDGKCDVEEIELQDRTKEKGNSLVAEALALAEAELRKRGSDAITKVEVEMRAKDNKIRNLVNMRGRDSDSIEWSFVIEVRAEVSVVREEKSEGGECEEEDYQQEKDISEILEVDVESNNDASDGDVDDLESSSDFEGSRDEEAEQNGLKFENDNQTIVSTSVPTTETSTAKQNGKRKRERRNESDENL